MAEGGTNPGSDNRPIYSIQRTYMITPVLKSEKPIITCDNRIDIPTIEPLVTDADGSGLTGTIVPCIELVCDFLDEFNFMFETNEGVTVLPDKIPSRENPYNYIRYVLVLPRGATGVKSCKLIHKATGIEIQHNFTFGIMPPPYNYDNALFGDLYLKVGYNTYGISNLKDSISEVLNKVDDLQLTTKNPNFSTINLPKGAGKQTINIKDGMLFFKTGFTYNISPEPTIHKPKIILNGDNTDFVYTLSLNRTTNTVSIDLLTGMLTVYDIVTGEIIQQFKLTVPYRGFNTLSFENFDDIDSSFIHVTPRGARVK